MPGITLRPAEPHDLPLILDLIGELAAYEREPDAVEATQDALREHLFGGPAGERPVAECIIGELDDEAEGFALFFTNFSTWRGRPGLYLEDLFVRPRARGRGLGKALFLHLAGIALDRGHGRMEWAVLDWNSPAIEFYKSLGAVGMSEWTTYRLTDDQLRRLRG